MEQPESTARHRARYDWERWSDGNAWRAIDGEHFHNGTASFVEAGRRWAERHDCTWRATVESDGNVLFTLTRQPN